MPILSILLRDCVSFTREIKQRETNLEEVTPCMFVHYILLFLAFYASLISNRFLQNQYSIQLYEQSSSTRRGC